MYEPNILNESESKELILIARKALESFVRHEHPSRPRNYDKKFDEIYGVLCTLQKNGEVRGQAAIGLPYPLISILEGTISAVVAAASEDSRFPPITSDELDEIKIELSITTEPKLLERTAVSEKYFHSIIPGADGIIMKYGIYESFLPPQAWGKIQDKETFLEQLCLQAGLTKDMWKEDVELYKFNAQILKESFM